MDKTKSRRGNFRRFFFRGLAVVLPATLTLWVLVQAYLWVDSSIAQPINAGVRQSLVEMFTHVPATAEMFGIEPTADVLQQGRADRALRIDDTSDDHAITDAYYHTLVATWWETFLPLRLIGLIIAAWGMCEGCPADLDGDGMVNSADLGLAIARWTG